MSSLGIPTPIESRESPRIIPRPQHHYFRLCFHELRHSRIRPRHALESLSANQSRESPGIIPRPQHRHLLFCFGKLQHSRFQPTRPLETLSPNQSHPSPGCLPRPRITPLGLNCRTFECQAILASLNGRISPASLIGPPLASRGRKLRHLRYAGIASTRHVCFGQAEGG